jgi:hypothetical protein
VEGIVTAKKSADTHKAAPSSQVPVGSVEIESFHDFPDFVQDVPDIEYGFNLPVETEPVPGE